MAKLPIFTSIQEALEAAYHEIETAKHATYYVSPSMDAGYYWARIKGMGDVEVVYYETRTDRNGRQWQWVHRTGFEDCTEMDDVEIIARIHPPTQTSTPEQS